MRALVLRARDDARRTAARLQELGIETLVSPVIEIRPNAFPEPQGEFDGLIATSAHAFGTRATDRLLSKPIFVVGERTEMAARATGHSEIGGMAESAARLVPLIRKSMSKRARLLYLAGRDRKPDLEHALVDDHDLVVVETYAAEAAHELEGDARKALLDGSVDVALHYSRRSAEVFVSLVKAANAASAVGAIRHLAISHDAAAPLIDAHWRVDVAQRPDEDAMIALLHPPRDA